MIPGRLRGGPRSLVLFLVAAIFTVPASLADEKKPGDLDVPYEPTHPKVVEAMLNLARVTSDDYVIDLGCGDGRIVIAAASAFGAHAMGVDIDPQRIEEANLLAEQAGVTDRVRFEVQDIMETDIHEATVVTLYLLNEVNLMLRPRLFAELNPGTRVVSHAFHMSDWEPDGIARNPKARGKILYTWIIPASAGGTWMLAPRPGETGPGLTLDLNQEFQAVGGVLRVEGGEPVAIEDPQIVGREISFKAPVTIAGHGAIKAQWAGTVNGDAIEGTQTWEEDGKARVETWTANRVPADVTGAWEIIAPERPEVEGVVSIHRVGRIFKADFEPKEPRDETLVPTLYVWGNRIRLEIPDAGTSWVVRGRLEGAGGSGNVGRQGWSDTEWTARRAPEVEEQGMWLERCREVAPPRIASLAPVIVRVEAALCAEPFTDELLVGAAAPPQARRWNPDMGAPQAGDEWVNPKDGSILVWIPGGEFVMGSDEGAEDERPAHTVRVEGFWLARFEITNEQYAKFLAENDDTREPLFWNEENFDEPRQPVVGVRLTEAMDYAEWAGLRLPSEREWEYAAAGGTQAMTPTSTGEPDPDLANVHGVRGRDKWQYPSPVGRFPPNPFGLFDLAGNAWDWTSSVFLPYSSDGDEPPTASLHSLGVLRGGCWAYPFGYARTAYRHRFAAHLNYDYAGFRLAATSVGGESDAEGDS